jgi:hypothetical protein
MDKARVRYAFPLMGMALLSLLLGIWAGLRRMGWGLPVVQAKLVIQHGPLMVSGFLGTLLGVERAIAVGRRWAYLGPLATALGSLVLITGAFDPGGILLMSVGSLIMVLIFATLPKPSFSGPALVMAWGALSWFVGNDLWFLGFSFHQVLPWWMAFLVLTIAGERLELGELRPRSRWNQITFILPVLLVLLGCGISVLRVDLGTQIVGAGMLSLGSWLFRYDIARDTARKSELPAYIGRLSLGGYVWLMVAGVMGLIFGGLRVGPIYDVFVHSLFIGFAFSMIFAHAPIILTAAVDYTLRYRPALYAPALVLHATLLLRVIGGLMRVSWARRWGGMGNALAILAFMLLIAPKPWSAQAGARA